MNYKDLKPKDFELLPKGDKINARPIELDNRRDTKVFIFRDESGSYSCLLQANFTSEKLPVIKGLDIIYQEFGEPGAKKMPYILIECGINGYVKNFTEILKEIIAEFDGGKDDIVQCVIKIISRWRYFLSEPKADIMTEENIAGLIGELMFLGKLLPLFKSESVNVWTAERGEEDFINGDLVVEVKSTLREKHEHIINGIDQLLIIPGRTKYILSLLFIKSGAENSINLVSAISSVSEILAEYPEAHELFFRKLKSRGYDSRDAEQYLEYSYSLVKGGVFKVDVGFPKLTTKELSAPLNPRISKIRYLLDLEGLDNLNFIDTDIKNYF